MNRSNKTARVLAAVTAALVICALIVTTAATPAAYAQGAHASPRRAGKTNSTTVLVYMNGSDLESEAGEATADIAEMLESGIGDNANVLIETLGTREWQDYGIASDHTQRYRVRQGKLELVDDSLGQLDTTSPHTLSDFIAWGAAAYPADRYVLLLWDHGAGPVYGFGYDEFQDEESALTLDEMRQALEANPNVHFDIIGMDCCIMGSLETCLALRPFCDYMVLSEDFEPGIGWSYQGWMNMLEKNPAVGTVELGTKIVDDMIGDVAADPANGNATLALVDESAVDALYKTWTDFAYANAKELLETNYSQQTEWQPRPEHERASNTYGTSGFFGHLVDDVVWDMWDCWGGQDAYRDWGGYDDAWSGYDDWGGYDDWDGYDAWDGYDDQGGYDDWGSLDDWAQLFELWDADGSFVTMTDYFVTDLMTVANSIEGDEATALKAAFDKAMVHFGSTSGEEGMSGLGVTLPYGNAEFYAEAVKVFGACGVDDEYLDWLGSFVGAENPADATDVADPYDFGYGDVLAA